MTTRFYGSGHGIGGNGDINNDGISDFILGYRKGEETDSSGMECYFGENYFELIPDLYANEEQKYSSYGKYTDFIGDFNGDDYDDIFVVATTFRENDIEIGKLYVYSFIIESSIPVPKVYMNTNCQLYQNYPNPFNNTTIIPIRLNAGSEIEVDIFDVQGKRIKNIFSGIKSVGLHDIAWNGKTNSGKDAASGVYFVVVNNYGKTNKTNKKIILIR